MKMLRQATIYAAMACIAFTTNAQEPLSKEITVEKEIIPHEREASRLLLQPQLMLNPIQQKKLKWTDRAVIAPVTPGITILPPAQYASSIAKSPYAGYFDIGYFPEFQLGASAGYRFIDNESTKIGAWLQYDGSQYKRTNILDDKLTYKNHVLTIGADLTHRFDGIGTLSAGIGYGMNSLWFPVYGNVLSSLNERDNGFDQTANRFGINLDWDSKVGEFDILAGVDYGYFGFSKPYVGTDLKALKNNTFSINAGTRYAISEKSLIGAEIKYSSTSFSEHLTAVLDEEQGIDYVGMSSSSYGVVEFNPYFIAHGDSYSARLGIELSAQTGDKSGVNIGPDVRLDWMPSQQFSIYARARAGYVTLNNLASMMDRDSYINPSISYLPTRMKGQLDLGLVIGPFAGASFEVWGGYGKYENANLPIMYITDTPIGENYYSDGMYAPMKFKSTHYGIAFNYNYRDMVRLRASYEGAPQDYDSGYLEWLDRAKSVIEASLTVTPISPLDITLGYRLRNDRAIYTVTPESADIFKGFVYGWHDLGKVSSLNLSAAYRFNDRFTVWADAENLLGEDWQIAPMVPNAGITGLIGISYKF